MSCMLCGWAALTKRDVCKGTLSEGRVAWQVMTRAQAQAGNRASKTEHYLQWWDNSPEQSAKTPAARKRRNHSLFGIAVFGASVAK